jgi:hypothetical protein
MKQSILILVISWILLSPFTTIAQWIYPALLTNTGIVFGKYKFTEDVRSPLRDTISLEEAHTAFALNTIYIDENQKCNLSTIGDSLHFWLTIIENNAKAVSYGNTFLFSNEIVKRLHKVKTGARLIFENIIVFSNGESRSLSLMDFIVH